MAKDPKEYVAVTEARGKTANEDVMAALRTVRVSFNEDLLETMCEARWDVDIDDLTDEVLMRKIRGSSPASRIRSCQTRTICSVN